MVKSFTDTEKTNTTETYTLLIKNSGNPLVLNKIANLYFSIKTRLAIIYIMASLVFMLFFFLKLPGATLIDHEIQNTGHTVLFMLLSMLFLQGYRLKYPCRSIFHTYISVFILLNVIGIIIELLQIKMARDADVIDLLRNASGIIIYFGIDYFLIKKKLGKPLITSKKELSFIIVTCIVLTLSLLPIVTLKIAYTIRNNTFPTILDFNSSYLRYFYTTYNATVYSEVYHIDASPLGFNLVKFDQAKLSGISIIEPVPDWRGYTAFCFNIYTPLENKFELTLRINDTTHNYDKDDRFNHTFFVSNTLKKHCYKLSEIEISPENRKMNLAQIKNIQLFQSRNRNTVKFYLSHFWLE